MRSNLPKLDNKNGDLRILCADDNTLIGQTLAKLFEVNGYDSMRVQSGQTALEIVLKDIGRFDVLIVEHEMRQLNGNALARLLRGAGYHGRIIVHCPSLSHKASAQYVALSVELAVGQRGQGHELLRVVETFHGE